MNHSFCGLQVDRKSPVSEGLSHPIKQAYLSCVACMCLLSVCLSFSQIAKSMHFCLKESLGNYLQELQRQNAWMQFSGQLFFKCGTDSVVLVQGILGTKKRVVFPLLTKHTPFSSLTRAALRQRDKIPLKFTWMSLQNQCQSAGK